MKSTLGKNIKTKTLTHYTNTTIISYSYNNGIIVGKKRINSQLSVPIIEFIDSTRVWILKQEIIESKNIIQTIQ